MFENRSRKLDLAALALAAAVMFLGVSLWTYDRFDPPSTLIFPPTNIVHNACGWAGAFAANYMLETLGLGAYYVLASLAVLTALLLAHREIDQPVLRAAGWVVSLVGLVTLAALVVPNWTPGPVVGSGGFVGALGRGLLEMHFAHAGAFIFALSVLAAGLLLATDYHLLRMAAVTTQISGRSLAQLGQLGQGAKTRNGKRRRVKTDLEDGVDIGAAEGDPDSGAEHSLPDDEREIRVRTPADKAEEAAAVAERGETDEVEEDEAAESVEESVDEDGAEAEVAATSATFKLANGIKSALGIKNRRQQPGQAEKSERQEMIEQLEAAEQQADQEIAYELPPLDLLLPNDEVCYEEHEKEVRRKAKILEKTFKNFGFNVRVVEIETGPVIAQYEVELEAGLRLSKISGLADDLAIALRVPSVRIVAPIPGKNTVGIEVPNENRQLVRLREVIEETNGRAKRMKIPIYLGKDVAGNPITVDLTTLPHLLIAGRTGTGKSVCLNSIILSILMSRGPDEVRMLMIDPKMVELSGYRKLPHLMHPVVTDMRKAEAILAWAVEKMEERYLLLSRAGVRHVSVYNQLGEDELRERIEPEDDEQWRQIPRQLPYIVIVADELADLMMTSGKDVEQHIIRLAQKSRAVGIHLILATQKPTVDVITGLIKSNLPARIAFQVASRVDSRVVLDEMGADKLLGNGDMLFLLPGTSTLLRGQGTYLSDDEITRVVDFVGTDDPQFAGELMQLKTKEETEAAGGAALKHRDELYETAVDIVVRERRGSVSLLQRALGIGYGRGARLIDFMAEDGIVGEYNGSQAREVLVTLEQWEAMSRTGEGTQTAQSAGTATALTAAAPRYVTVGGVGTSAAAVGASGASNALTVAAATGTRPPRRNRIVPEPSDLEDEVDGEEDSIPFDADSDDEQWEEVDEDADGEWEEDDGDVGETALAVGGMDKDQSDESDDDEDESETGEAETDEEEDESEEDWDESEDEWEEDEELSRK
ncbi:MAG TPA: DNA translocase FtsK 4TM domain-containing protein [Lacipirellulaceae bacterium]|jgi:S-DNA-T family DNA segregation ATPase FtsK/SpoIIIE